MRELSFRNLGSMKKHKKNIIKSIEEQIFDPQRSIRSVPNSALTLFLAVAIPLVFDILICVSAPRIFTLWRMIFRLVLDWTELPAHVRMEPWTILPNWRIQIPSIEMLGGAPTTGQWLWMIYLMVTGWVVTKLLPEKLMPLTYAMRFFCVVQATSVIFFGLWPGSFP